jgi:hypothetical protein
MNCQRAATVLQGLETNQLVVTTEEIEELLALGLAIEADPDDQRTLNWLQPILREHAGCGVEAPEAPMGLATTLQAIEEQLKGDWYRMRTSKPELQAREKTRIEVRRALAVLYDGVTMAALRKLVENSRLLAPGLGYVCCEQLGSEYYAMTHKGWRVRRQLEIRLARFAGASLKAFLAATDKVEAKMSAFSAEIATLSQNIGYVKKNREQVVIGLAKTGMPSNQALGTYQAALRATNHAPDVAVTCARHTAAFGNPAQAAQRLGQAQAALRQAGFPATPIVMGSAKALLAFDPPASGAPRFVEIFRRLEGGLGRGEIVFKFTARLMPAAGTPEDVVRRTMLALRQLAASPSRAHPMNVDERGAGVALASMARADDQLPAIVARYRDLEAELARAGVSTSVTVGADALECVACPGTPAEVVDLVASLARQLATGRRAERADVAVAVAFAKRFAF